MLSSPPTSELSASSVIPVSSGHCHPPPNSPHTSMAPHQLPAGSTAPEMTTSSPSSSPPPTSSLPLCSSSSSNSSLSSLSSQPVTSMCHELSCVGCCEPIRDRYLMCVSECYWHEQCLQCAVCRILLTHSCYLKERKLYCKQDYNKLFSVKCTTCCEPIGAQELVMRVQPYIYHMCCFVCMRCGRQLHKGDEFAVRQGRLLCRVDLAIELENEINGSISPESQLTVLSESPHNPEISLQPGSPESSTKIIYESFEDSKAEQHFPSNQRNNRNKSTNLRSLNSTLQGPVKQDGRRGPKRPRTILNTAQRRAFKASFEISSKPCRKVREILAKETGLNVRIVQVWFQNQRAKLKKIQRKQQLGITGLNSGNRIMSNSSDRSKDNSSDDDIDHDQDDSSNGHSSVHYIHEDEEMCYKEEDDGGYAVHSEVVNSETDPGHMIFYPGTQLNNQLIQHTQNSVELSNQVSHELTSQVNNHSNIADCPESSLLSFKNLFYKFL